MKRVFALVVAALVCVAPASRASIPATIDGLTVKAEQVTKAKHSDRQYLSSIKLYSLRKGKLLEATLEFGRFRSSAPVSSVSFQRSIAQQLGTTVPVEQRLGGVAVYLAKAKSLTLAAWFSGRQLTILSIRTGYVTPKSLIRSALDLTP